MNTLRDATGELAHLNRFFHEIQDSKFGSPFAVLGQRCGGNNDHASTMSAFGNFRQEIDPASVRQLNVHDEELKLVRPQQQPRFIK